MIVFGEPLSAVHAAERLACVCVFLTSLEWLLHRHLLDDGALAGWPVSQLARRWTTGRLFQATAGRILVYPTILFVVGSRLLCSFLLLLDPPIADPTRAALALSAALASILMNVRSPYGHDGADQMATLTLLAIGLGQAVGTTQAQAYALWFVAAQSCLSYFTAGIAKSVSPVWRSGAALPGILSTQSYGLPPAGLILHRHPLLSSGACWVVIILECAVPLALLGLPPLTFFLVSSALLLHLLNVLLMRLNTFFWAFLATYPAIIYCSQSTGLQRLYRHV